MSILQFILIISALIFTLFGIDLYKRKKVNILHAIVFLWWWIAIIIFTFNQNILNSFGEIFWIARWADLLVYVAIILLFYFYISLLNSHTKDKHNLTRLVSQNAINECRSSSQDKISKYKNQNFKDEFIFNIRVYNEWLKISSTIDEVIKFGFSKILIVNDWSQDNSLKEVQKKQKQYPDKLILLASHTINRGGGAANQTWYNFIKKYWEKLSIKRFVWFDADWQMNVKDMDSFIEAIQKKPHDLYLWSRFIKWWAAENMPIVRKIVLNIAQIVTKLFYSSKVSDPHNWYRVISLNALKTFNLTSDGMHYANEFNEQLQRNKLSYMEVPVYIRYTDYSIQKWQKNSNSIKIWLEMIYKKIFFR